MSGLLRVPPMRRGAPRGGRGYLLKDERASGGVMLEVPTLTCAHCGAIVVLHPQRTRERGSCRRCNAYVCDLPACRTECNPIEQGVELSLAHPGQGPFLARGPDGAILFDPRLRDRRKVY